MVSRPLERYTLGMAIETFEGYAPFLDKVAFVAPSADLIGRVSVGKDASVWYNTTLRGDLAAIEVGDFSNVQDNSCIHTEEGNPCRIGKYVTVGHCVTLHACTVEDNCLIGMGATVLDGAVIGQGSIVGANALVTKNTVIPPRSLVLGCPAKIVKTLDESSEQANHDHACEYVGLAQRYRKDASL